MKRKVLSCLMALVLVLGLLPGTALAGTSTPHTAKVVVIPVYEDDSKYLGYDPDYGSKVELDLACLAQYCGGGNINHTVKISGFHPSKLNWTIRSGYEWKGWIKYTQNLNKKNVNNPPFATYYNWSSQTTNLILSENYIYMVYKKAAPTKPDLSITKTANVSSGVKVGDEFTYTITVKNATGAAEAKNVEVVDTLPTGLEYVSYTINPSGCTFNQSGQKLTWIIASIAAGNTATITLKVKATQTGIFVNKATVSGVTTPGTAGGVTVEESAPPTPKDPSLSITKTASTTTANVGEEFIYTITVKNAEGAGTATNVEVEDTLPSGLEFVSSTPNYTGKDGQKLTWKFDSIEAGSSKTITLKVKATEAGTYRNTATIKDTDKSATAGDVTVKAPKLSVTKTTTAEKVKVGDSFTYTITVSNAADAGKATDVMVQDILPTGLEYVSYTTDRSDEDVVFTQDGQTLNWTFDEIPAGSSVTITFTVKALTATAEGDGYENKAYIVTDDGGEGESGTAPSVPVGAALELTKTPAVTKVNVGEIFSYTLTVENVSKTAATDVTVEDVLPSSLEYYAQSVSGNSGTCTFEQSTTSSNILDWTFATIPAGEKVTITLRVRAISADTAAVNSAAIASVTEVTSNGVSIVTPGKGTLTVVKKVGNGKLDEAANFTFTLKRHIVSADPSGEKASYTEDTTFTPQTITVSVAKGSDTGSKTVDLPEIPAGTVYTVEEEALTGSTLKMAGTTGTFSKAEYVSEVVYKDGEGSHSTGAMENTKAFSTMWPGQEITSVTVTCTNSYELLPPTKYTVTVNNSYASSTGAGDYAADETVAIHAGSRTDYTFNGWTTDSTDVTLANASKADTTFTMPSHAVTVTASWTYNGPSHSGGDDDDDDDSKEYYFAIKKVDAQDSRTLNGAKFGLYLNGKQIATATSNRSGIATFRIDESDYKKITAKSDLYYQELTAPEGYVISNDEVSVAKSDLKANRTTAEKNAETVRNYRSSTPDLLNDSDHFAYVIGYKDGLVKPYGLITRAETTTIFFRLLNDDVRDDHLLTANTYTDVLDNYWANTAISTMTGLGIVQGRSTTTFDPGAPITRAQFAAICARFDTGTGSGTQTFSDISGHWAEKYIQRAAELGWIKGFEDGTFRPDTYITRAQAMTMINRVLNRIPEDTDDLLPNMNVWADCNPGDWFYLAVQEATNSHDFKHKGGNYETWTKLTTAPDWTRYEN